MAPRPSTFAPAPPSPSAPPAPAQYLGGPQMHQGVHRPLHCEVADLRPSVSFSDGRTTALRNLGFPIGMARSLTRAADEYLVYVTIPDTSTSMTWNQGHIQDRTTGKHIRGHINAWNELRDRLCLSMDVKAALGVPHHLEFFTPQIDPSTRLHVDSVDVSSPQDAARAKALLPAQCPGGGTPLGATLQRVRLKVEQMRRNAVGPDRTKPIHLEIDTDGEPGDSSLFVSELRRLVREQKATVVIRLCTDDPGVIEYYNDLDRQLGDGLGQIETCFEVLDDDRAEARELKNAGHSWLRHGWQIGVLRTMAPHIRALDFLDESKPAKSGRRRGLAVPHDRVVRDVTQMIYGLHELPTPRENWKVFKQAVTEAMKNDDVKTFHPRDQKRVDFVNLDKLGRRYGGLFSGGLCRGC